MNLGDVYKLKDGMIEYEVIKIKKLVTVQPYKNGIKFYQPVEVKKNNPLFNIDNKIYPIKV